jgi:hypothetical protein
LSTTARSEELQGAFRVGTRIAPVLLFTHTVTGCDCVDATTPPPATAKTNATTTPKRLAATRDIESPSPLKYVGTIAPSYAEG